MITSCIIKREISQNLLVLRLSPGIIKIALVESVPSGFCATHSYVPASSLELNNEF